MMPTTKLSKFQKGIYCTGINLIDNIPLTIKCFNHDIKLFKLALKKYLISHFCSVEEFTPTKNVQLQTHVSNNIILLV
jgi:hypothetical protein